MKKSGAKTEENAPFESPLNKMKIAFICNEFPPRPHGGIGTFIYAITHALAAKGHEVTVIEIGRKAGTRHEGKIKILTLIGSSIPFLGNLISRLRLRNTLDAMARRREIDIVEVPDYMGLLPFGLRHCPTAVRLHLSTTSIMIFMGKRPSRGIGFYEKKTLSKNGNWIAVSEFSLKLTQDTFGFGPKRVQLIYYPVAPIPAELPEITALPPKFILYAGTVSRRKGAVVLAKAARELFGQRPDIDLVYVGGKSWEGGVPIEDEINEIVGPKFASRVHFLGHQPREHVLSCMKKAAVFAFPSKLETLGLVVLEAMDCETPVVCTNFPPGPELVSDGVTGLLADPLSPDDFRIKISLLLENPELGSELARNARDNLNRKFSMESCVGDTEKFYANCIKSDIPS